MGSERKIGIGYRCIHRKKKYKITTMPKSWFDSVYDLITGENYDTDPNVPENRVKRLETPKPVQPNLFRFGRDVPIIDKQTAPQPRSAWEDVASK